MKFRKRSIRQIAWVAAMSWFGMLLLPVVFSSAVRAEETDEAVQILERASQAFTRIAREATPAVVFVRVEKTVAAPDRPGMPPGGEDFFRHFFGQPRPRGREAPPRERRQAGHGSGFIVSPDGYILTSNHVVEDADTITVRLHDGREFEAEKVGGDPQSEVAVIKIDGAGDLPAVTLGDSAVLETGEWVIAIGNPFGLSESLTVGVVSATGRAGIGLADYEDFIQTDAAINPGNSGGPLLNIQGHVIGINTAIFTRHGGYMGIGFAVPINMARAIKQQLIETGEVVRGHLGIMIQEVTVELAETFGLDEPRGILIGDVLEDSPAERQGLQDGDIILTLDGEDVENVPAFRNRISLMAPGTTVDLTVFRDGEIVERSIEIGTRDDVAAAPAEAEERWQETLGLAVTEVAEEAAQRFGYEPDSGALVSEVTPYSPAARAGIRPGHLIASVDRQPVTTPAEFYQRLEQAGDTVLFQIREGPARSRFVAIRLP